MGILAKSLSVLLKRAAIAQGDLYDVICEDKIVGRIMLSKVKLSEPWVWMLAYDHHGDRTHSRL
jgi:hypothetical protein